MVSMWWYFSTSVMKVLRGTSIGLGSRVLMTLALGAVLELVPL
jgi:hypothetical protein